jgi:hypothetical protein
MKNDNEVTPKHITDIYEYFIEKGKTKEEAEDEIQAVLDSAKALEEQSKEFGYSIEESQKIGRLKVERYLANIDKSKLKFGKIFSMKTIRNLVNVGLNKNLEDLSPLELREVYWKIGLDTKEYNVYYDVGCFSENGAQMCGEFVYGSERTDKEWEMSGHASDDVRYRNDRDELAAIRNTKDWSNIAKTAKKAEKKYSKEGV